MNDDEETGPADARDGETAESGPNDRTAAPRPRQGRPGRQTKPRRALGDVDAVPVGRVTALHARRSGSSRFIVDVEGHPAAVVSSEVIGDLGLRVGVSVDSELAERLREAAGRLEVFDKAIAFLAIRARSTRDLQLRLRRAGAPPPAISAAIDRLLNLGLLDDEAYARTLARSRALSGGVSKRRIGQELQRQGVARDVADAAVAETIEDVGLDESEAAMAIALRRVRALRSLDVRKQRQRLYAFLARRGYDAGIISKVVASVVAGAADDEVEDES